MEENNKLKQELSVFEPMAAMLEGLKHQYDIVHTAETKEGYAVLKDGVKDVGKVVRAIEKARKEKKSFYLETGRAIDRKAKEVTFLFSEILGPMKALKKEKDDEVARIKAERIAKLQARIDKMNDAPALAQGKGSEEISEVINDIASVETATGFYELTHEATVVRSKVLEQLSNMLAISLSFEESEKARKELEVKQKVERAERAFKDLINEVKMTLIDVVGKDSDTIKNTLRLISARVFEGFDSAQIKEILIVRNQVVNKLGAMLENTLKGEEEREKLRLKQEKAGAESPVIETMSRQDQADKDKLDNGRALRSKTNDRIAEKLAETEASLIKYADLSRFDAKNVVAAIHSASIANVRMDF